MSSLGHLDSKTPDLIVVHPWTPEAYGPLESITAVEPPLWARLITGYVVDQGFSVRVIDAEADQKTPSQVALDVFAMSPRLVCLCAYGHHPSASTQSMDTVFETARQIRSVSTAKIVVVGGHVSALPIETLRACEAIDYVVIGEGPTEITSILAGGWCDPEISGLAYRGPGMFNVNRRAPLLDLSLLRGNAWRKLPMWKYRPHNWQVLGKDAREVPYASIYTSLGCPYACEFCCINAPFGERRYRTRPPEHVATEVEHLYNSYGVRTLKITDEMFVLRPSHYVDVCERLAALDLDLNIWAYARVDTVRENYLQLLRRAGIQWLALGIESASPHVRDKAEKHLKCDDIVEVVKTIQAAGINVIANYIFGLPGDDEASMAETAALSRRVPSDWANFYCAAAYPGSPLYTRAVREGWRLPATWGAYAQHAYDFQPLPTARGVQSETILTVRDYAHRDFFASSEFLNRTATKFGPAAARHVTETQLRPLPRKLLETAA